jgi:hypothetical protein
VTGRAVDSSSSENSIEIITSLSVPEVNLNDQYEEVVLFCGAITFVGYHLCFYAMCLMGGGNLYDLWWCMMFCDHRGFKLK